MFDRIEFLIAEAFTALRRNTWMSFAAVTTTCMALFLLGGMVFAYLGINSYASQLPSRFEMRVFLKDGSPSDKARAMKIDIERLEGVEAATFLPRDQAWAKMRREMPDITKGIDNPLPDAYSVTLDDVDKADQIAVALRRMPLVEKDGVKYESETRELISQTLALLRWVGLALGGLMLLTGAILIYNAIRLTIVARRKEIRIMRLVGATRATVVTPLLIEGVIQGAVGGLLAALLILGAHRALGQLLSNLAGFIQLGPLAAPVVIGTITALGCVYGFVCSALAVRDPRGID